MILTNYIIFPILNIYSIHANLPNFVQTLLVFKQIHESLVQDILSFKT